LSFKLCVIGCGNISERCHAPSYIKYRADNPDFELVACCDIDEKRAEAYARKFGFKRHYSDYSKMLQTEKPDAVTVLINENHIADVATDVIKMGFPVFMEKPPGKTISQTHALIKAAAENNTLHAVGYNRRNMPILKKLRSILDESIATKDIQFIRYDMYRVGRFDEDFSDTAIHGIDAVRYLTNADYEKVRFTYQHLPEFGNGVKNIYMDCIMTSGVHAQLSFCPVAGVVLERAVVNARDKTWMANIPIWEYGYDLPGELTHIHKNEAIERISGRHLCDSDEVYVTNGFYDENKEFFDNVKAGRRCRDTLEDSINSILIKDCVSSGTVDFKL